MDKLKIKKIGDKAPDGITIIYLEAVIMPNGEIISSGKTLGWFDKCKKYVYVAEN